MHGMTHPRPALLSPIFWVALAVLAINDHVLKGAGILPGEITGKLSDLAGMIVAPVVLVALLGLRARAAKAAAFAVVALGFATLELSPAAAAAWDRALGAIGIPSRSWADPSDLVGLAMLPIAWWLVRERSLPEQVEDTGLARALQKSALVLGLFACAATTEAPPPVPQWTTGAWIHNRTADPIDVRLRWADAGLSCAFLDEADLGAAAAPAVFGDGATFRLEPGDTVPIEPDDARVALGAMPDGSRHECDLVRVSIDGLDDTVVFWEMRTEQQVPTLLDPDVETVPEGRLSVVEEGDGLALEHDTSYRSAPLQERASPAPAECGGRGEGIAHSDLGVLDAHDWTVTARSLLVDGCTELELARIDEPTVELAIFLCVPGDFVPFEPGDVIGLEAPPAEGVVALGSAFGSSLLLGSGLRSVSLPGLSITFDDVELGCAARMSCDAFVAPARVVRAGAAVDVGTPFVVTPGGRMGRALVARAEHVVVAPTGCDTGLSAPGTRIDVVVRLDSMTEVP